MAQPQITYRGTEAFDVASRQLEDVARIQRGEVKRHHDERGDTPSP